MDVEIKESEFHARGRIIRNYMKERNNCVVLKIDTHMGKVEDMSPFGFHFEFDEKKYKERKKQIRREKITWFFAWLAYYHHKFGIRHITLISILAAYICLGGFLFQKLESPREIEELQETLKSMNEIIKNETMDIIKITLTTNGEDRNQKLGDLLRAYHRILLETEGKFHGSAWHKSENLDMNLMWYFSSATFYSMTLFSTIGYGTITCQTFWGKTVSMVYASIGLPIMLLVLGDIGVWFQKVMTNAYIFVMLKYKSLRKQSIEIKRKETLLPMWLAMLVVFTYIIICTLTILLFDDNEGDEPGINFFDAFYFTFISLTTIGLGDVMPYNIQYSPFLPLAFLLGLALISIVNTSIYSTLYQSFYNLIYSLEDQLDRIHNSRRRGAGYRVFQDMESTFQMLVCTFPPSPAHSRIRFASLIRDSFREAKKESAQPKVRTRTESDIPDGFQQWMAKRSRRLHSADDEMKEKRRAPTLGALGGFDMSLFKPRNRSTTSPFCHTDEEVDTDESV
ncbi:Potassium channel domain-containing protein [Caenorhabditis elegans]|uniref:Potassium channel domain-containing protein n=2 Tax=Caenorhabditis elegans TaxID=6239 RepID=Q9BL31_CAEEL|nr:Potassium channel domain-containing protein [Caenorhabditis elegans]CCD73876.2 Potassium channel domain-containing protein [Caenorhabditis elegans]|eukprot:NP_001122742.2 TWiK family of potassium channels [Caenorhabditis elegans]